jgi:Hint domain
MPSTPTTFTYVSAASTGSPEFDWSSASNWTNGEPSTGPTHASVYIPAGGSGATIYSTVDDIPNLTIDQLEVASGAAVTITSGNTLTIGGQILPLGSGAGQVTLSGTNTSLVFQSNLPTPGSGPEVGISLAGTSDSLVFQNFYAGSDNSVITGFGNGDKLDIQSFSSISSYSLNSGNTLTVTGVLAGTTYSYTARFTNFSTISGTTFTTITDGAGGTIIEAVCFAAGTRLFTPAGERAVEDLREGDEVLTLERDTLAPRPITWVGRMRVNLARHPRPEAAAPVRIRRGAFADNVPHRDLLLSPEHCVFVDGRLVAAKCLVNGLTIVQELDRPSIEYFHIETERHSVVLAEGLTAETYLDTGNRALFDNAGQALLLHPEFHINAGLRCWETHACAPLATDPAELEPIWRRLADRAAALGYVRTESPSTTEAAPRLLIDGREIAPLEVSAQRAVFLLPAGASEATLLSRIGSPADHAPYLNDHRRLGVAVSRIVLRDGAEDRVIPADHPALVHGWHPVERTPAESWRWTDGRARLPLPALSGPTVLELHLTGAVAYRLDAEPARQAA